MRSILECYERLEGDQWRASHPFSDHVKTACEVLLNPFTRDDERRIAIRGWLVKNQPCVFGQAAAKADRQFISIVDDELLSRGDEAVKEKLELDRRTWKQWSLGEQGRHGFLLAVVSPKVHYAAPNRALKDFAQKIRSLFAMESTADTAGNDMVYEWLYLKNPDTGKFHKFRVILDFFASAGDGRWWQDHRFPGGIAFTFNSLGHMAKTRHWYEKNAHPIEWSARLAMLTIDGAFPHPVHGRATWLLDLKDGNPNKTMGCPFRNPQSVHAKLQGKDWTTYQGHHHTDHSIREEFFDGRDNPDRSRGAYLLDFSYIAGASDGENKELMDGIVIDDTFVDSDIGPVGEWRLAKPTAIKLPLKSADEEAPISSPTTSATFPWRPPEQEAKILAVLKTCKEWLETEIPA